MKKRIIRLVSLVIIVSMMFNTMAFANNIDLEDNNDFMEEEYQQEGSPNLSRWSYTSSTIEGLSISSSGTATMTSRVTGYSGTTTKIDIYFYLQKYDGTWKNVKTYKDTINNYYAVKEHTYSPLDKGYDYRLRCTYYVYGPNNQYDHFMEYTSTKHY